MANLQQLFSNCTLLGVEALKKITDPYQQAMAAAAIASAIAQTQLLTVTASTEFSKDTEAQETKESIKPQTAKTKAVVKETKPVVEEKAPETEAVEVEEQEFTEEWDDNSMEAKKEQIAFIQALKSDYEISALNDSVKQFSEGVYTTLDEISPLNIDAFIEYIQGLIAKA